MQRLQVKMLGLKRPWGKGDGAGALTVDIGDEDRPVRLGPEIDRRQRRKILISGAANNGAGRYRIFDRFSARRHCSTYHWQYSR